MLASHGTKYIKYKVMRRDSALHSALPRTRLMSRKNLFDLLSKYSRVVAKPTGGSQGVGVMMITSRGDNRYSVHDGARKRTIQGKDKTYSYIRSHANRSYIVQRGIRLARVNGRPFDIRVMVQRRRGSAWVVTGMLAKVAGPGFIVTNIRRSGGKAITVPNAIRLSNIAKRSTHYLLRRIESVALRSAKRLATHYTRQRVFGLDMGIDVHGRVWIIEANLTPDYSLFLKLKDKAMYRRIISYRRSR